MEIATQLDENHAEKLTYIQQHTNQDLSEILNQAIDLYYEQLNPTSKSPLEVLQEDGLVGLFEGNPDLSKNYKAKVHEYLDQKYPPSSHDHHRYRCLPGAIQQTGYLSRSSPGILWLKFQNRLSPPIP